MFSGIVGELGEVVGVEELPDGARLRLRAPRCVTDAQVGESIAVSGACLTVVAFGDDWFEVEAVAETLRRTRLGGLKVGDRVNLEKSLKLSDRLGGHLVMGHVDALATVAEITEEGVSWLVKFELEPGWAPYFVEKGSVAVDGVSLTVVDCAPMGAERLWFRVALIPHTMQVTSLGAAQVGDRVNIETDILARYVVRLLGDRAEAPSRPEKKE